jgi:uncharacterized membrane protein YfcA
LLELVLLALLGCAVGAYGTVIGAGGGFVLVPLLLFIFPSYGPEKVTAISLAVVWANASSGSIAYARQRRIDYVTGVLFALSSIPGVVAGALVVHLVPERAFSIMFGLLLLAIVIVLLLRPQATTIREPLVERGLLVRTIVTGEGVTYRYAYRIWQAVALSLAVGFASSLFGIGGGVIHVPAMIMLFRIPVPYAVATSHFILACMALGGTIVHLANGTLSGRALRQAVALGVGAVVGAQAGAALSHRLSGQVVLRLLAFALVALAARLLVKGVLNV